MPIIADVTTSSGPTLEDLVTELINVVQGFSIAPDKVRSLKADVSATALTMVLDGAGTPGVYEVEDELVYVTSVDPNTATCTIHPKGRGWQGSTAVAHDAGALVAEGPALSRHRARGALNDAITKVYPDVFGIATATAPKGGTTFFEIPSDAEFVLDVRVLCDDEWTRVRSWEAEMSSAAATTGCVVRLPTVAESDTVQVVYATRPEPLAGPEQQWSDTGLSLGMKEVVVLGALSRVAQAMDLGRLTDRYATTRGDAQQPQLGSGFAIARQLRADYQAALDREALALRTRYPARAHFTR